MVLGVVLHSAQVYNPQSTWLIHSQQSNIVMELLVDVISTFRMPAFFVVSGFFAYVGLVKYNLLGFLRGRIKRILIPLIFCAFTLNSLQALLLHWTNWQPLNLSHYLTQGEYVHHLWFLINLTIYFFVCGILYIAFRRLFPSACAFLNGLLDNADPSVVLFTLPVMTISVLSLERLGFPLYSNFWGLIKIFSIMSYLPYFVFGMVLGSNRRFLMHFSNVSPLLIASLILLLALLSSLQLDTSRWYNTLLVAYIDSLQVWIAIALCFYLFARFFNRESKFFRLLADSSYSIYLLHHLWVVAIGLLFILLDVPAIVGCLALVVIVCAITLLTHLQLVSRNRVLSLLLNGK